MNDTNGGGMLARVLRPEMPLRVIRAAPAGWPPDVAPGQIIASSHINAIRDSAATWPGQVNANGQNLIGAGVVDIVARNDGTIPFVVRKHDASAAWLITQDGALSSNTSAGITTGGAATALGGFTAGGAVQLASTGLNFGAGREIQWKLTDVYWDVADLALGRMSPGRAHLTNPSAGTTADLFLNGAYADNGYYLGAAQSYAQVINAAGAFVGPGVNTTGGVTAAAWVSSKGTIGTTDAGGVAQATLFSDGLIRGRSFQILRAGDELFMAGIDTAGRLTAGAIDSVGAITSSSYLNGVAMILRPNAGAATPVQITNLAGDVVVVTIDSAGTIASKSGVIASTAAGVPTASMTGANGVIAGAQYAIYGGAFGVSGTFTSANGKTVTVSGGIITSIV